MIKKLYLFLHFGAVSLLLIGVGVFFTLTHSYAVPYLAQKYLKEFGVEYGEIEGSLLSGITVSDVGYGGFVQAKKIQINYNLLYLLRPTPKITAIRIDSLELNANRLPKSDENSTNAAIMAFAIRNIELKNAKVALDEELYEFDLKAKEFRYDEKIDAQSLSLDFKSSYANATLNAKIAANTLQGDAVIEPSARTKEKYLNFLSETPERLKVKIDASRERILLWTDVDSLALAANPELELKGARLKANYSLSDKSLKSDLLYKLEYREWLLDVNQSLAYAQDSKYASNLDAVLLKQATVLPFKTIRAKAKGDANGFDSTINAGSMELTVSSKEYEKFLLEAKSDALDLAFLENLPRDVHDKIVSFKANATVEISPLKAVGSLSLDSAYASANADFDLNEKATRVKARVDPKPKHAIFKDYPMERLGPIKLAFEELGKNQKLEIEANLLRATLLKKDEELSGFGNLASAEFTLKREKNSIALNAKIASLKKLLIELKLADEKEKNFQDANAEIDSVITLGESFEMRSNVSIPWFSIKTDSQTTHLIKNATLSARYKDKTISIEKYHAEYMDYKFYSKKESTVLIDDKNDLIFKEFWLYDNLLVKGKVSPSEKSARLKIRGDKFNYVAKDVNVSANANLEAVFDANGTKKIAGDVTLLDGFLSYAPVKDYQITDKDIIIIQDIKTKEASKLSLNLSVNSIQPIRYKTKEMDVRFVPELRVTQEPNKPLKLFGKVTILDGELNAADKEFRFGESYVYFDGKDELDPNLNLRLLYSTLDNIEIEILITNTLSEPIIIFSSNPAMSQNDIMSYILFGERANSLFEGSNANNKTSVNSLLLGTGLKQMFGDVTGVQVDTLNILNKEDGTLGYEVGARFNKNVRVVYKSDTTSSVTIQYGVSKSLRFDVDVREAGQGVAFTYVKDFKTP